MSTNAYARFGRLIGKAPLLVGTVTATSGGTCTVTLPGGAVVQARGNASVSDVVFLRDGAIEGPAPTLSLTVIEV